MIREELLLKGYNLNISKINDKGNLLGVYVKGDWLRIDDLQEEQVETLEFIKNFKNIMAVLDAENYLSICFDYDKVSYAARIERLKRMGPYGEDISVEREFEVSHYALSGLLEKLDEDIRARKIEELKRIISELEIAEIDSLIKQVKGYPRIKKKEFGHKR